MLLHKKRAEVLLIAIVFCARSCVTVLSSQGIIRHHSRESQVVELQADGFLDGAWSNKQKGIEKTSTVPQETLPWKSVPECARNLFGRHAPNPPNARGMQELLPGIDAFYIIHDTANHKRQTRLENAMKSSRLGEIATWVTWFSEEDLPQIPHQDLACIFNRSYAEPLFTQSISAPLSRNLKHLWVYHEMARRRLQNVLVMEDNAIFRGNMEELIGSIRDLTSSLPADYGVVMLGDEDLAQGHKWRAEEIDKNFQTTHAAQKVSEHLFHGGLGHRGASGYLIDAASASTILMYVHKKSKADCEADVLMENALGPDGFYWYEPALWVQSQSPVMVELETPTPEEHSESSPKESHDDAQWALYHRYLGTSGDDDPYRGARERHHSSE